VTKNRAKPNFPFFLGAFTVLVFGLLAAFVPGLAYVGIRSDFTFMPYVSHRVHYYPFAFGVHMFTLKLVLCAIGGATGLFSVFETKTGHRYISFAAIAIAILGLALPAFSYGGGIPEVRYFEMPWLGFLFVFMGVSVMFLSLTLKNRGISRIALFSVPLLLISYSTAPIMVSVNYFPRIVFDGPFSVGSILLSLIGLVGQLLMIWGTFKAVKSHA